MKKEVTRGHRLCQKKNTLSYLGNGGGALQKLYDQQRDRFVQSKMNLRRKTNVCLELARLYALEKNNLEKTEKRR
jgi:hypothetical protein